MTTISFTSGELLDIISALDDVGDNCMQAENVHLASYYAKLSQQFEIIYDKVQGFVPENRVANLALVVN
jgi:arginyl-tRNA synthetase